MGLYGVEIIMEVERDFGVRIDDYEAEQLKRVGEMHALIVAKLLADPDTLHQRLDRLVWTHLVSLIAEQMNVRRSAIRPGTRFIEDLGVD